MRTGLRAAGAATLAGVLVTAAVVASAGPAAAHGVGGRSDLPLPLWMFTFGASTALVVSFVALRALWTRPLLRAGATGRPLLSAPAVLAVLRGTGRLVGLGLFALVLSAAFLGDESTARNIAPIGVYVVFWLGVQTASVVVGDLWRVLNPLPTIALLWRHRPDRPAPWWTAGVMLLSFVWMELAYHDPSDPRAVGVWLAAYSVTALAGSVVWGARWLRNGEGFAVLFGLLASIAPLYRDDQGRVRLRPPLTGLATIQATPGLRAVVFVVLGSTTFDGFSRTRLWRDVLGTRAEWSRTLVDSVGLLWIIALVWVAYHLAVWIGARVAGVESDRMSLWFVSTLVPILFAYTVAHYFSLFVFEGQGAIILASDPYGVGWDLFGTATNSINYLLVSTDLIAYVQAGAIVVGHVAGVIAAHDRSVELWPPRLAERTQYPLLAVMIAYTVGGLAILVGS